MIIQFPTIKHPSEWLKYVSEQFGAEVHNMQFEVPAHIGRGIFRQYIPFEGLAITYHRFMVYETLEFIRNSSGNTDLIPIMFYTDSEENEQLINKEIKTIGFHSSDGIFMSSGDFATSWSVEPNQWRTNITLTLNKQWICKILNKQHTGEYLKELLLQDKAFYIFETLSSNMQHIIQAMIGRIEEIKNTAETLHLYSDAIQLLAVFFEKVEQRKSSQSTANLNSKDIDKCFEIRKIIIDNPCSVPLLKELASIACMSVSKLQQCFKTIFGKTISGYVLLEKMELAKRLLQTRSLSVSEVGHQLGYANLGHFSEAFNKYHKINPKKYLSSL